MRDTDVEKTGPGVDTGALSEEDRLTAKLVRKHDFITEEDLEEALFLLQGERVEGKESSLLVVLLGRGMLNEKQLRAVEFALKMHRDRAPDRAFVRLAVRRRFMGRYEAEEALRRQADLYRGSGRLTPVSDLLVEYGILSPDQRTDLLKALASSGTGDLEETSPGTGEEPGAQGDAASGPRGREKGEATGDEPARNSVEPSCGEGAAYDQDTCFEVVVAQDLLSARVVIHRLDPARVTSDAILDVLQERGVVHGLLRRDEIEKWFASGVAAGSSLVVAHGDPPLPGQSAEVRYYVTETPKFSAPADDVLDLKGGGRIPGIAKGTLLAEKTPMIPERQGMDVFGREILVEVSKEALMLYGPGIERTADGLKLYAAVDGRVEFSALGKIAVLPELIIDGDIGYETGNIEFDGLVDVRGNIQDGFRVKAGSLRAKEISKAQVEVFGDLVVSGGILGATIKSQGTITAVHVHASRIEAQGDVNVDRGIVDSRIITSGRCLLPRGTILTSAIAARYGVEVRQVGSDRSGPCTVVFNVDPLTEREIVRLKAVLATKEAMIGGVRERVVSLREKLESDERDVGHLVQAQDFAGRERRNLVEKIHLCRSSGQTENLEPLEKSLATLDQRMKEADKELDGMLSLQDELREQIAACQVEIQGIEGEAGTVRDEILALAEWGKGGKIKPAVKVFGTIFTGSIVKGALSSMVLSGDLRGVMFRETRADPKGEKGASGEMRIQVSGVS